MPSIALKITPLISNENNYAKLIADPKFIKQYVALLEPLNTKFNLCSVNYPGVHQALFIYIVGYNFGETFIVLRMIKDIVNDYQGDINLAWKTGVKTITDNIFKDVSLASYVVTEAVVSTALKALVNHSLPGKTINQETITNRVKHFSTVKTELEIIKKALPARKAYLFFHPSMAAKVDDSLKKITKAEKDYRQATSYVLIYNQQLKAFFAKETLENTVYSDVQNAISSLEKYNYKTDPSIDYNACMEVLHEADSLVNEYFNNDYNKRRAAKS